MAVDASHAGCFAFGARLFAVPSDSPHSVAETRASYVDAAAVRRKSRRRPHWSAYLGGVIGGGFIDLSTWHTSKLTDVVALALLFALGAGAGFATALGIREALVGRMPDTEVVRLPAIEIPSDVARLAPDDATADELVLWSILTRRFRAAKVAVDNLPFEQDPPAAPEPNRAGSVLPAHQPALAELAYVTARHDFEPVAELLGLPLPR